MLVFSQKAIGDIFSTISDVMLLIKGGHCNEKTYGRSIVCASCHAICWRCVSREDGFGTESKI
jgi:uncharacterized protein YsxB (DUF464 family)